MPGATALTRAASGALTDEITGQVSADLRTGEEVALPVSLVIMIVVFGGFLAAGLPLLGALASIAGALAALLAFSYVIDLDSSVVSVVTVLGLGLCIDYGLLLTSRFREELRIRPDGALERTLATAGRTVLFSGLTVAVSLAGLMLFSATVLRAVGAAGVSVVGVALLVALTLVPALLTLAGRRLVRPGITQRLPVIRRLGRRLGDVAPEHGVFSRLAATIQRRPVVPLLAVLGVLAVLAIPVLQLRLVSSGVALLPPDRAVAPALRPGRRPLPGGEHARRDRRQPVVAAAARAVGRRRRGRLDPRGHRRRPGARAGERRRAGVRARRPGGGRPHRRRARPCPTRHRTRPGRWCTSCSSASRPGEPMWVTGQAAFVDDFVDDVKARGRRSRQRWWSCATFVLLFLLTGSVLVPLKALVLVVVSLGASLGVLVWGFQQGHLEGVLSFDSTGGIETLIPVLIVALGFGLSMDYEVFLLARIKELRDAGLPNDQAVAAGLQRSGRIITSAALVIVVVFLGFAAGELLVIKQTGIGLAVTVAIDATLVRLVLVPATMTLLGEWNWWAPGPLRRLHARLGVAGGLSGGAALA